MNQSQPNHSTDPNSSIDTKNSTNQNNSTDQNLHSQPNNPSDNTDNIQNKCYISCCSNSSQEEVSSAVDEKPMGTYQSAEELSSEELARHSRFMARALDLATKGLGFTFSNPMVGAVIVDEDGKIVGEGFHRRWGEGHAEVNAVASVGESVDLSKFTIYVTLEPCSHYGKTPPCSKLIIDRGIGNAVIATVDPFPSVAGRGINMLRQAGVNVVVGVMESECQALNQKFMFAHRNSRPWITLKWAQSRDGFINDASDKPTRFSNAFSSLLVHQLRQEHCGIMVGAQTVITDNPSLTVRNIGCEFQPVPIIMDRKGRVPVEAKIFSDPERKVIYFSEHQRQELPPNVLQLGTQATTTSLEEDLKMLYKQGIISILVEGGSNLLQQFIDQGLYNELRVETADFDLGTGVKAPKMDSVPQMCSFKA